jgi:hypothetical protein
MRLCAPLLAAALACGGDTPLAPLPDGAVLQGAPDIYGTWWHEVEQCSGKTGDFNAVSWYYVPGQYTFSSGTGADLVAVWLPSRNAIVLAEFAREDSLVVTHEELHAILRRTDHPAEYFVQKCGNLVAH